MKQGRYASTIRYRIGLRLDGLYVWPTLTLAKLDELRLQAHRSGLASEVIQGERGDLGEEAARVQEHLEDRDSRLAMLFEGRSALGTKRRATLLCRSFTRSARDEPRGIADQIGEEAQRVELIHATFKRVVLDFAFQDAPLRWDAFVGYRTVDRGITHRQALLADQIGRFEDDHGRVPALLDESTAMFPPIRRLDAAIETLARIESERSSGLGPSLA